MKTKNYGPIAPPEWFSEFNTNPKPSALYDLKIETKAGGLQVTFYGTWIATRFDNPKEAAEWVDACDYTGKWNFFGEDHEHQFRHYLSILKP